HVEFLLLLLIVLALLCGGSRVGCVREARNSVTRQPKHRPFVHWLRVESAIKLYRRFVPIEHSPFHPAAAPVPRNFRKLNEQCAPITFAALFRFHEQVFEVKPRPPQPGGKIVKVNCEPNRRFSLENNEDFRGRSFPKQSIDKLLLCRGHLVWRTLIRRQIPNQFQDDWHVFHASRTNLEFVRRLHSASDCRARPTQFRPSANISVFTPMPMRK